MIDRDGDGGGGREGVQGGVDDIFDDSLTPTFLIHSLFPFRFHCYLRHSLIIITFSFFLLLPISFFHLLFTFLFKSFSTLCLSFSCTDTGKYKDRYSYPFSERVNKHDVHPTFVYLIFLTWALYHLWGSRAVSPDRC